MKKRILTLQLILLICLFAFTQASAQQWGLYTLYATKTGTQAFLIDTANTPVTYHTWNFTSTKKSAYSTYLIPGDTLVRTYGYTATGGMTGGGVTGGVQKVLWDNTVVWDYQYNSSTYTLHHDICPLPNGNVLMIAYEVKTVAEATQAGASSSTSIWAEKIMEVKPTGATTGTVVWEWHLWDHLCQNVNAAKDNYVTSIVNSPQLMNINYGTGQDRWHMNGLDYNSTLNQIAISIHNSNEIYVIDHSTTTAQAATHTGGNSGKGGDFLYRWGNPAAYGATGTTDFNVVHDAHWVPSDNPNYPNYLCAYNNKGGSGNVTAIDIINPPYNGYNYNLTLGSAYAPTIYSYRFTSAFSAQDEGNSQQLPNGNMLVNNAFGAIYEVNAAGTQLWTKASTNSSHAYRFSLCYVRGPIATAGASSTSVTSGTPVTLSSSALSVTETSPTYTYSWSPATMTNPNIANPVVTPNSTTTYTVLITNTSLGCTSTASVTISTTVGINENDKLANVSLFPNPTSGIINLSEDFVGINDFEIVVSNSIGKIILQANNERIIDLSTFSNGIYYVMIRAKGMNSINKKVILIK